MAIYCPTPISLIAIATRLASVSDSVYAALAATSVGPAKQMDSMMETQCLAEQRDLRAATPNVKCDLPKSNDDLRLAIRELRNVAAVLKAAGEESITIEFKDDEWDRN
jgi:hypothetical protein